MPPNTTRRAHPAVPRNAIRSAAGIGSTDGSGICHSYAPDGRCISLLKILLTNFCQYDCLYCVNRVISNVPRARFTVDEVVQLTLDFYRATASRACSCPAASSGARLHDGAVVEVARACCARSTTSAATSTSRPSPTPRRAARQGRPLCRPAHINIELPTEQGCSRWRRRRTCAAIRRSMARLRAHIDEARQEKREIDAKPVTVMRGATPRKAAAPHFAPPARARR